MILFAVVASLMVIATLAVLLPPLFGAQANRSIAREDLNVALYRDRLAELELELADGSLSSEEFEHARSELQRDLLVNVDEGGEPQAPTVKRGGRWMPWVVAVAVPVLAVGFYLPLGTPDLIDGRPAAQQQGEMPDLEQALAELERRLADNPDNPEGWSMLGRSLLALDQYERAADAYGRAIEAVGPNPSLLLGRAQAVALATGNSLDGEPIALIRQALEMEPNHSEALWLAGLHSYQTGRYEQAADQWERAQQQVDPNSELGQTLSEAVAEARARASGEMAEAPSASAADEASIEALIELEPTLAEWVAPDHTVFVFARAPGAQMPIVAKRYQVSDLPLAITLDDGDSMAGASLSEHPMIEVVARISRSGSVTPESGDVEAIAQTAPNGSVRLTLERVLP